MAGTDERTPAEKRRERGRAVLMGLFLALGVVALVLLGGRRPAPESRDDWPAVAGIYRVVAHCEGCGCEPSAGAPTGAPFAIVHPGLPVGRPVARSCTDPASCATALARRAPAGVRSPVVLEPGTDVALARRELEQGPPLAPIDGSTGYASSVARERRGERRCVVAVRSSELTPLPDGRLRWTERYANAKGERACPESAAVSCVIEVHRVLERGPSDPGR